MFKIIPAILLIILQFLDIFLTKKILSAGGRELNPLIRKYGYWIKIPVTIFALAAGFFIHPIIILPPILIMIGVCIWNYYTLKRVVMERKRSDGT